MLNAPGLVENTDHISTAWFAAAEAQIPKESFVVPFTIGLALLFKVPPSFECLFTVGTHKMLRVPCFPQSMDDSAFNWTPASCTDGRLHVVIATQTVQLSIVLTTLGIQHFLALGAVKVFWMNHLELVDNVVALDREAALLTELL